MTVPLPDYFKPHTAVVRAYGSGGGMGGGYGEPFEVASFVVDSTETVTTSSSSETTSSTQVTVDFDSVIPLGSLVTVWPGLTGEREAPVISITRGQHPTLPSFQTLYLQ
jgi:hypothetical protein